MQTSSRLLTPTLALALGVTPWTAAAQVTPIVQAGAEGRFEIQLDRKTVDGFRRADVSSFAAHIDRMADMLGAIPQVRTPSAPICRRIRSSIALIPAHGVLSADVGVMTPINFRNGRCNAMTGGGVVIWLNQARGVITAPSHAHVRGAEDGAHDWVTLNLLSEAPDRLVLAGGVTVLKSPHRPLYRPVSLERYYRETDQAAGEADVGNLLARFQSEDLPRLRQESAEFLETMRAWASPAQIAETRRMHEEGWRIAQETYAKADAEARARPMQVRGDGRAQACILRSTGEAVAASDCADGDLLWELDPDYFDRSRPADIQLIVIESSDDPYHGASDLQHIERREIRQALDLSAFAPS